MDQLFAPWRIDWVEREESEDEIEGCVFCELPERGADREQRIVARSEHAFVLLNNAPYSPGHAMVIPYEHAADLRELDDETTLDHAKLRARTIDALETAYDPEGFNVGLNLGGDAAGGSIDDHLHTHVVPRWSGDTNFMPVISDAKVIVEAIEDSYERLHDAFAAQPGATTNEEGEDGGAGEAGEEAEDEEVEDGKMEDEEVEDGKMEDEEGQAVRLELTGDD